MLKSLLEWFIANERVEMKLVKNRKLRTTADKRLRYASPKLPSATSFIHKTLSETVALTKSVSQMITR